MGNYCVFLPNHIYNVITAPENYIILRSRMKSIKVKENEASILTTVQKRLNVSTRESSRRLSGSLSPFNRNKKKKKRTKSNGDSNGSSTWFISKESSGLSSGFSSDGGREDSESSIGSELVQKDILQQED